MDIATPKHLDGKSDSRIPYILKLASQKDGVTYTQEFNTVLTADLLLGVLRGEIGDPASAVAWLDRNRTRLSSNWPAMPRIRNATARGTIPGRRRMLS